MALEKWVAMEEPEKAQWLTNGLLVFIWALNDS
jgi:hypothetical protein